MFYFWALLRQREEDIHDGQIWEIKPIYFFVDPLFFTMGMKMVKSIKKQRRRARMKRRNHGRKQ